MPHHLAGNTPLSQSRNLLDVQGLSVGFATDHGIATVVRDLDLHIAEGETLAIVGEFGFRQVGDGAFHHAADRPYRRADHGRPNAVHRPHGTAA